MYDFRTVRSSAEDEETHRVDLLDTPMETPMTSLEILNAMKSNHDCILWINHERRDAAFHPGNGGFAIPVTFNDAVLVRTDTSIQIVEKRDGEILQAV